MLIVCVFCCYSIINIIIIITKIDSNIWLLYIRRISGTISTQTNLENDPERMGDNSDSALWKLYSTIAGTSFLKFIFNLFSNCSTENNKTD